MSVIENIEYEDTENGFSIRYPDNPALLPFQYNDGGRAAAGFKGAAGDCACRALTTASRLAYIDVYQNLNQFAKTERISKRKPRRSSARNGYYGSTMRRFMAELGWVWVPTMFVGSGCQTHLRRGELPTGRLIVNVSRHYTTVINDVINDTYDCSRSGTRCVYGYWYDPEDGIDDALMDARAADAQS